MGLGLGFFYVSHKLDHESLTFFHKIGGFPFPAISDLFAHGGLAGMLAKAKQILISELALAERTDEEKAGVILDEVLAS